MPGVVPKVVGTAIPPLGAVHTDVNGKRPI